MQIARENSTSAIVKIVESACAADTFFIRALIGFDWMRVIATHTKAVKTSRTDSESRFLANKKFFVLWTFWRPAARERRRFWRIDKPDSRRSFPAAIDRDDARRDRARCQAEQKFKIEDGARPFQPCPRHLRRGKRQSPQQRSDSVATVARRRSQPSDDTRHQSPSLLLSRSLTACGLALPPDDFIT